MAIIEQLDELAQIAPGVCRQDDGVFVIGDYHFWDSPQYGFCAGHIQAVMGVKGRPALDWLEGALRQVIEARGWDYEHRFYSPLGMIGPRHKITLMHTRHDAGHIRDTVAEALLAALIAALGGEG